MKTAGVVIAVLALAIGLIPMFTDCESQGKAITLPNGTTIAMRCHWTARAELATAGPLLAIGLVTSLNRKQESLRSMAALAIVLGVFVILLPTSLIGVCANPDMLCSMVMKPALVFAGILVIATGLLMLARARRLALVPVASEDDEA
jgi:hypothetical protein